MKYIMFNVKIKELEFDIPIIFPNNLVHIDIAEALFPKLRKYYLNADLTLVAAGELNSLDLKPKCSGRSETLQISSRFRQDDEIINLYDYEHGVSI